MGHRRSYALEQRVGDNGGGMGGARQVEGVNEGEEEG
jgi:hypothetical protein